MALPTFPPSWYAPTTCFDSTDIWVVVVSTEQDTQWLDFYFGVPATTPTGDCLPPYYDVLTPYVGNSCPLGYSTAGSTATTYLESEVQSIYCCPGTYYSFEPANPPGCLSGLGNEAFIASSTNPFNGDFAIETFSDNSGYSLQAYGITLVSTSFLPPPETSSSSYHTTTSISTPQAPIETAKAEPSSTPTGLSAGAAAGIGVGAGLGTILLALAGWLMYRRRGRKLPDDPITLHNEGQYYEPKTTTSPVVQPPGNDRESQATFVYPQAIGFSPSPTAAQA
ncbi:hypothetical protein F4803DRAFT_531555 [Xylaria telfairii]|nr:hypothetical protein F4803DRAFT_531555 [Xylaria telfairii]